MMSDKLIDMLTTQQTEHGILPVTVGVGSHEHYVADVEFDDQDGPTVFIIIPDYETTVEDESE